MFWLLAFAVAGTVLFTRFKDRAWAKAHRAEIVRKYAVYRSGLTEAERERFDGLAERFVTAREWVGEDMVVQEEMKAMIGAAAAQLLLGLSSTDLPHFHRIIIHRQHYRSARTRKIHLGETRPATGEVVISWNDLVFGYSNSHDAENVALHELAHALWFENLKLGDRSEEWTDERLQRWNELAAEEIERIRKGESRLLSSYAGTNEAEFFAVATEFFFERPLDLQRRMNEHYALLCELLGEDPAARLIASAPGPRSSTTR